MLGRGGMKFGIWHDYRNPPAWRRPYGVLYRENLAQIRRAEELGFDAVWLSEHHVTEDGYLPSLFPMLAAIAASTERIRIGTAVLLAPLQDPIRFAEDAAVVDQLSNGRLELGLGLGYRLEEFRALGIDRAQRAARTEELVAIARRAWTGEPFDHQGAIWQHAGVQVTPPPLSTGGPPLWIGGSSRAAARRAGRLGCGFMPDASASSELIALYRASLAAGGHDPATARVAVNPSLYVTDDPERAWTELRPHFQYAFDLYQAWGAEAEGRDKPPATPVPRERFMIGTPGQLVEAIEELQRRTGFEHLFFWSRPPGLSIEQSTASLERFAAEVMPRLRPPA